MPFLLCVGSRSNWLPQEERGKGSVGAASYSGMQCLAPLAGQNFLRRAPKSAFFVMRRKSLELVAARRDGERKCRGGKLFGHAELPKLEKVKMII